MRQKALVFLFMVIGGMVSFFGCAPNKNTAVQKIPSNDTKKIIIWHWMTDRENAFDVLAKRYKELTGTEAIFELYAPSDIYAQKVRGAAQTQTLPDIFGILAEKRDFASFIKGCHILNLSPYMEEDSSRWKNSFFEKALTVNEFLAQNEFDIAPGIYGVPIDVMNIQMLYNKDLFKKSGLDPNNPPRTWQKFLEVGNKLNAAGIQGMASGWAETWMINCLLSNYAYNIMGEEKFIRTIKGEVSYNDPDWIKVFSLFKDMSTNHLLANGIVSMVNKHAEQMFANERCALAFNGSWCVNVYYGMNPNLNYGVMPPPSYSDAYPMAIWGGAGASFMVNAKSKNQKEAVDFLKWLTAKEQQAYLSRETRNLPSNRDSLSEIPPTLAQFANSMDKITHLSNLAVSELPRVIEARDKGVQSIIIGEKTPEEVALEVESVKLKEMGKLGR